MGENGHYANLGLPFGSACTHVEYVKFHQYREHPQKISSGRLLLQGNRGFLDVQNTRKSRLTRKLYQTMNIGKEKQWLVEMDYEGIPFRRNKCYKYKHLARIFSLSFNPKQIVL